MAGTACRARFSAPRTSGDLQKLTSDLQTLDDLSGSYAALFCDVWGVVHNGVAVFDDACRALVRARGQGAAVVLLTNSPRRSVDVVAQLAALGVPAGAWDRVVTSGDVTRVLIEQGPRQAFHIGPERDLSLFDGLDIDLVEEREASVIICTGLFDDEAETPADYADLLRRLRSREVPLICANPDINVHRGSRMIWCAGALARDYSQLGGRTLVAGKPFAPIYQAAMAAAGDLLGREVSRREVLAIGDGMLTDVKGAADFGLDVLYVSGGIHVGEYGDGTTIDRHRLAEFLARHGQSPVATLDRLR
jgi:HAD superfamily hydrolase (TIGR01459 family)